MTLQLTHAPYSMATGCSPVRGPAHFRLPYHFWVRYDDPWLAPKKELVGQFASGTGRRGRGQKVRAGTQPEGTFATPAVMRKNLLPATGE